MSYPTPLDVARGLVQQGGLVQQYGLNTAVGSDFAPVARSGFYRTPQPAAATALRIAAGGNAADSAAGTGARKIRLTGLSAAGELIQEELVTAGASASAATSQAFLRLFSAEVSASGSYANQTTPSHASTITVENAAGTETWAVIQNSDFGRGKSEIAVYSVPANRKFYLTSIVVSCDTSNKSNIILFSREDILSPSAPYSSMKLHFEFPVLSGFSQTVFNPPLVFPELTDVGFMAKTDAGTITVSASLNGFLLKP